MISFGLDCNPIAHWQHVSALMLTQFPLAGHTSPLAAAVASNSSSVATPQCIKLCCLQNEMCEIRKQELLGIMQEQQAATHLSLVPFVSQYLALCSSKISHQLKLPLTHLLTLFLWLFDFYLNSKFCLLGFMVCLLHN